MIKNSDIEPRHFNFRLFLDDYTIKPPTPGLDEQSSWKAKLSATEQRRSSRTDKIYYNELEELQTFCCLEDEKHTGCEKSREHASSFCLANFQPRKDSMGFSDLLSIFSFGSNTKCISFKDISESIGDQHFQCLRERLAVMLDAGVGKAGLE